MKHEAVEHRRRPIRDSRWDEVPCDRIADFASYQSARVARRSRAVWLGLNAGVFWCGALIGASWLEHWGLSFVSGVLLGIYAVGVFPGVVIQVLTVLDLVIYSFTGRSIVYPAMWALTQGPDARRKRTERRRSLALRFFAELSFRTSPIAPLWLWCMTVLSRLPESAYVHVDARSSARSSTVKHAPATGATVRHLPRRSPVIETYWETMSDRPRGAPRSLQTA